MLARVYRMSGAALTSPRIAPGIARWARRSRMSRSLPNVYRSPTGNTRNVTPKTYNATSPSTNVGVLMRKIVIALNR